MAKTHIYDKKNKIEKMNVNTKYIYNNISLKNYYNNLLYIFNCCHDNIECTAFKYLIEIISGVSNCIGKQDLINLLDL